MFHMWSIQCIKMAYGAFILPTERNILACISYDDVAQQIDLNGDQ